MIQTLFALPLLASPFLPVSSIGDANDDDGLRGTELVIERGEDEPELRLPREEKLVFGVRMQIAIASANVGRVTMRSTVEPYRASVLGAPPAGSANMIGASSTTEELLTGALKIQAKGEYAWYSMDASIETRILPQDWPRFSYRYTHDGSERRRREVLMGERDGEWTGSYRKDTRKGAPKGTRIWRDPSTRTIPENTLDLLSAVYLSRTLIQDDLKELRFPLIDKLNLWDMRLKRGKRGRMETEAGTFKVVEILLDPKPFEGEEVDEEKAKKFEGLFGLHGSIHLWVQEDTGVPVRIQGSLPAGPLTLNIDIELKEFEGTPEAFKAV